MRTIVHADGDPDLLRVRRPRSRRPLRHLGEAPQAATDPLAGALFALDVGVKGLTLPAFKG